MVILRNRPAPGCCLFQGRPGLHANPGPLQNSSEVAYRARNVSFRWIGETATLAGIGSWRRSVAPVAKFGRRSGKICQAARVDQNVGVPGCPICGTVEFGAGAVGSPSCDQKTKPPTDSCQGFPGNVLDVSVPRPRWESRVTPDRLSARERSPSSRTGPRPRPTGWR